MRKPGPVETVERLRGAAAALEKGAAALKREARAVREGRMLPDFGLAWGRNFVLSANQDARKELGDDE